TKRAQDEWNHLLHGTDVSAPQPLSTWQRLARDAYEKYPHRKIISRRPLSVRYKQSPTPTMSTRRQHQGTNSTPRHAEPGSPGRHRQD
ncbi:MAG: hypothetical protein ACKPKO_00340, partial [Candidatus Fonsibacter sp.]